MMNQVAPLPDMAPPRAAARVAIASLGVGAMLALMFSASGASAQAGAARVRGTPLTASSSTVPLGVVETHVRRTSPYEASDRYGGANYGAYGSYGYGYGYGWNGGGRDGFTQPETQRLVLPSGSIVTRENGRSRILYGPEGQAAYEDDPRGIAPGFYPYNAGPPRGYAPSRLPYGQAAAIYEIEPRPAARVRTQRLRRDGRVVVYGQRGSIRQGRLVPAGRDRSGRSTYYVIR